MTKHYKLIFPVGLALSNIVVTSVGCGPKAETIAQKVVQPVNPDYFIADSLVEPIKKEMRTLSDGSKAECYVITTKSFPTDHPIGPWAPKHVTDGEDKGGIWIKDGHVYNVSGDFVAHLDELYDDPQWNLVREDGSIKVTETEEAFNLAARPNVDPRYHNHVVECPPDVVQWKSNHNVYVIPVHPVYRSVATDPHRVGDGHGPVGVAFNGVKYDLPAPIHMIIKAHTIAPFDHSGGHVNPNAGYHYHAATGKTKEIEQPDGHAPLIGYALDGFGIYAHLDNDGNEPKELDECSGHYDDVRGYHYHVSAAGDNQIIGAFRGIAGSASVAKPE
ncbi:MAG: YHYH protein [Pirellulaceae bacterium]|nr:YHYH protein [Pirellulaceae bacterium]